MRYEELSACWQRIFELEWRSVCEGSKAIAAVIADDNGNIISEGRNMIAEQTVPNAATAHAEAEAIRALDTKKYTDKWAYTLYAGLEPCIMCMDTLVMGGIRRVVIAAKDDFGGAMDLIGHSAFARRKNIQVTWLGNELGDMQRAFQTVRELIYNDDKEKLERMLSDFSLHNKAGVRAAQAFAESEWFKGRDIKAMPVSEVFNRLSSS